MLEQRLDAILGPAISHDDVGHGREGGFSDTVSAVAAYIRRMAARCAQWRQSRLSVLARRAGRDRQG